MRTFTKFDATFPDDAVFDSTGNPAVPGGRAIMTALMQALRAKGLHVSEPAQHSFYGWRLRIEISDENYNLVLQFAEAWLVIVTEQSSFLTRLFRRPKTTGTAQLLRSLHEVLCTDGRFGNVAWFTREEYERRPRTPGARVPW